MYFYEFCFNKCFNALHWIFFVNNLSKELIDLSTLFREYDRIFMLFKTLNPSTSSFSQFLFCYNVVNQAIFLSRSSRRETFCIGTKIGVSQSFDDDMACCKKSVSLSCVEISLNIQTFSSSKTWRQIERGKIWVSVKPKYCTTKGGWGTSLAIGAHLLLLCIAGLLSLIGVTKCEQGSTFFRQLLAPPRCSQFPSNLWHGMCTSMLIAI